VSRGYFITGTDTGVGKTLVSAALLHAFAAQGMRVVGMKPVAAGCEWRDGEPYWEDVAQLQAASNVAAPLASRNPYRFDPPIAPHIAAAQAGVRIDIATLCQAYRDLQHDADAVIVEGAGGFCVPLNEADTMADLAQQLDLPVILVVAMRLGCINHALLTVQAIASRGLMLAGWVANQPGPAMPFMAENLAALQQRIAAPLLGVLPHLNPVVPQALSLRLQIDAL
jgi:dethiobiotin synthetase